MIPKKVQHEAIKIGKDVGRFAEEKAGDIIVNECEDITSIKGFNKLSTDDQNKLFDIVYDTAWKVLIKR